MRKVIASLLAALLVFACAPMAYAEVKPPQSLVVVDNTIYVAAPAAKHYAVMLEHLQTKLLRSFGASSSELIVDRQQAGILSTGDTIRFADDVLTIEVVGGTEPARDPADVYREMAELAERSDIRIFHAYIVNFGGAQRLRDDPFSFSAFFGSDGMGYLFGLYHVSDRDEVFGFLDKMTMMQTAESEAGISRYLSFFGDVDLDGYVTARDARLTLRASALLEKLDGVRFLAADLDGNGRITASEARRILRVSARLETFA